MVDNKKIAKVFFKAMKERWPLITHRTWEYALDYFFRLCNESKRKHRNLYTNMYDALVPLSISNGLFVPKKTAFKAMFREAYGVWP